MRDVRPWTNAALFGALWGGLELSLGTALHLGRVPVRGAVMALVGLACLVTLRRLERQVGVCVSAGAVAVFLKVFTLGGLYPGPLVGIAVEAVVVELAFTLLGTNAFAAVVAGAIAVGFTPVQMLAMTWLVAGREALDAAAAALGRGSTWVGLPWLGGWTLGGLLVAAAALAGAVGGAWAWRLAARVARRVGRT